MSELSPKEELFVANYLASGCNAPRAAILVGSNPRSASKAAARFLARPNVQSEIAKRTAEVAASSQLTVEALVAEAEAARVVAETAGHAAAMCTAIALKGKLTGLLSDRPQPEETKSVTVIISGDDVGLL